MRKAAVAEVQRFGKGLEVDLLLHMLPHVFHGTENIAADGRFIVCAAASFAVCTGALPMAPAMACLGIVAAFIASINTHMLAGFPAEVAKDNNLSFASSIMDLLTYGGAGLGSLVFGVLIHRFGYGSMFILWAIGSVLASVVMFRMMSEKSKCVTEPYAKE